MVRNNSSWNEKARAIHIAGACNYVYPRLSRTGLGNMLFLWAKAEKISLIQNIPVIAPDWVHLARLGPWLRREKYKRYYLRDFTNRGYVTGLKKAYLLRMRTKIDTRELPSGAPWPSGVVGVVSKDEGFRPVIDDHVYIRDKLLSIVSPAIRRRVLAESEQYIGVHVRRGDFKGIGQDLPIEWYIKVCNFLRREYGEKLPVRVFSDAPPEELADFAQLPGSVLMPKAPAIQDIFMLAKSKYIVGSSMSTFSLWASYLNRRPTYWSPVSPGVHGYGLRTSNHFVTDWSGRVISKYEA